MAFLEFKAFHGPRSGWSFRDPDTGFLMTAPTQEKLTQLVRDHRAANSKPPIDFLSKVIENCVCQEPDNKPHCEPVSFDRSIMQYLRGGMALLMNVFYGEENMVAPAEAERRASICERCPYNVDKPDTPNYEEWSNDMASRMRGPRRTSVDPKLKNCAICTCNLKAKVWLKNAAMQPEEEVKAPEECWQKRTSSNFRRS